MPRYKKPIGEDAAHYPVLPDEQDPNLTSHLQAGGDEAAIDEQQEAVERMATQMLDQESSASDRNLEKENAELKAKLARLTRKWVFADYSDMDADHPFEVMIPRTPENGGHMPVKVCVNDHETLIARDTPTQVPKYIVEVLERARIKHWEKIVDEHDNPRAVLYEHARYPFTARPLYL